STLGRWLVNLLGQEAEAAAEIDRLDVEPDAHGGREGQRGGASSSTAITCRKVATSTQDRGSTGRGPTPWRRAPGPASPGPSARRPAGAARRGPAATSLRQRADRRPRWRSGCG